jgi:hypothetical protein
MAKKKAATPKETPMPAIVEKEDIGHARLELPRADFERLRRLARGRGLSISAYVRQAVLMAMRADEAQGVGH